MIAHALAAAAHRLGGDRDGVLGRIGGAIGRDTRKAATELAALDAGRQKLARAEWAARIRTPVPAGFRGVHGTWIEAALAPLPSRARAAVASGGGEPIDVWLARWATAGFVPMPTISHSLRSPALAASPGSPIASVGPRPLEPADLAALDVIRLATFLERVGPASVAPHLSPLERRAVVARLPRDVGVAIARIFAQHAGDRAASWATLVP